MIDEILDKLGLKYEELDSPGHAGEREQLNKWMEDLGKSQITVEGIKAHVSAMKYSVEMELTKSDLDPKQDLLLKARLRNYMLLESLLLTPERAREQIERNLTSKRKR